jgi:hypothetical protein
MRLTKGIVFALVIFFAFGTSAFAGAPAPTTERAIPVEQVAPPPPPPTVTAKPVVISKHFTLGLGIGGSPLIGFVEKDNYGYPRTEYGLISGIGFGVTWFSGYPTPAEIYSAVKAVKAKNPNISDEDIPAKVRDELGVHRLTYVGLGIINAEMGYEWVVGDSVRTRLGIGLPTIISFGINFDF